MVRWLVVTQIVLAGIILAAFKFVRRRAGPQLAYRDAFLFEKGDPDGVHLHL